MMSSDDETTLDPYLGDRETDQLSPASDPSAKAPEGEWLDRFRLERLIGRGGMGQVWQAWDPRLERRVAIKRLHVVDLAARRRFLREARLQATIAHPGVCPVFEVGQADGEPYLVMPYLSGLPLNEAVEGAALEHRLDLMRRVAEAVHAAHGQGLIHRDLKPANILVETPEDAPPRPVVLDFGIARPLVGEGLTVSGDIVGTPSFMAPEQVEGDSNQLDRRTDVYGLGATLFYLLAGHPPHLGKGPSLLLRILQEEPARLSTAGIPKEVEAILFKCLEKKKEERYDSALALADDLGRYLAGEPVQARPITRRIRLVKWLRRHRALVRVTALAAVLSIAALTWGAWSAWRSEERERLARRFGAQIEEIEALARYSHLVPLHDVRPDQADLRRRLAVIRQGLDGARPVERALAHHALGRGHLALDELETARGHLETAHRLDPGNAEIEADLGRTLSELYRERLTTLERTRDRGGRDSLREELSRRLEGSFRKPGEQQKQWQRTLEAPALDLLTRGQAPEASHAVELDALILFHDGNPEAALDLLAASPPAPSWVYERFRLEGDIRRSWAVGLSAEAEAAGEARRQLEEARRAYGKALQVAQSHAAIFRADAQAVALLVGLDLVSSEETEPLIVEAQQSLRQARLINPNEIRTWQWVIRLELLAADHRLDEGGDPTPHLEAALEAGEEALELDAQDSSLWFEIGHTHEKLGRWQRDRGEDPTAQFERAAAALARIALEDRDYVFLTQLGNLHMAVAGHRAERGLEADEAYEEAIAAYRSAAEIHSAPFAAFSNLGLVLLNAAHHEVADPRDLLTQALEIFQLAHEVRPDSMVPFYYLGLCRLRLAQGGQVARTILDHALAERARADFERAIELEAERFQPWVGLGELFHLQGTTAYTHGDDPARFFLRAREAYNRALELAPDQPIALLNLAWTAYFEGKYALREGQDASALLAEAEGLCLRSLESRRRPNTLLCLGSVRRMQAEHNLKRGELNVTSQRIVEAERLFEEILELDESYAEAYRSLGRLFTLEARRLRQVGDDPAVALERARGFLDRALELEDEVLHFHLAEAGWFLEQAQWLRATDQDFMDAVAAGRRSLVRAFEQVPESREAVSLQLRLLRQKDR